MALAGVSVLSTTLTMAVYRARPLVNARPVSVASTFQSLDMTAASRQERIEAVPAAATPVAILRTETRTAVAPSPLHARSGPPARSAPAVSGTAWATADGNVRKGLSFALPDERH